MRDDPEFKRKRKEYNAARWKRTRIEGMERARAWAVANPERTKEIYKASRTKRQIACIFRNCRKRAKARGLEFTIELADVVIPDVCPIFGLPFVYGATLDNCDFAPSIDRIDSSKGYVKGNVQVISRLANCMKWTATDRQLLDFAHGVLLYFAEKAYS